MKTDHTRDDFSKADKETLAKRVGYRCSNPNCRRQTIGPQQEPNGTVNVGVAAHIRAASPGGKRYDPAQASKDRAALGNAIWLCQTCAKLIDSDERKYTVELLYKWKNLSETAAELEIDTPPQSADQSTNVVAAVEASSVGTFQQAGRDITNIHSGAHAISHLEFQILKHLYKELRLTGKFPRWHVREAWPALGVEEGHFVGVLNDSKFIKIDMDHLTITTDGVRYMDDRILSRRPRLDLVGNLVTSSGPNGRQITFSLINSGELTALDIKCRLDADGAKQASFSVCPRLAPGEQTRQIQYEYGNTEFMHTELKHIKILLEYEDQDGIPFISGRALTHTKGADETYRIDTKIGGYFDR